MFRCFLPGVAIFCLVAGLVSGPRGALAKEDKQLEKADAIAAKVAKVRGLAIKNKIRRGVMSKAQIRKRIVELVDKEYTAEQIAADSLAMKRFGLIAPKQDFMKIMIDLLESQVAGFYDHHEKKLYIAGWTQVGGDAVMAHEIDHALQDQHFDLTTFMKPDLENSDSNMGRQALVEGDGMATMLEFQMSSMMQAPPWGNPTIMKMLKKGMNSGSSQMKGVPLAMSEALIFPYVAGLDFIVHFRKKHAWSRVDKIYKKPPLSTEHILHPEKYEVYEKPDEITVDPQSFGAERVLKATNVSGEKGLEILLRANGVGDERARRAAEGWGGDKTLIFANKEHKGDGLAGTIGILYSSWDDETDAQEFLETLLTAMPSLGAAKSLPGGKSFHRFSMKGGRIAHVERRGDRVLLALDLPSKESAMLDAVWKTWTVAKE